MEDNALLKRSDEVAGLVMAQAVELVGHNGVVGGSLAVEDPPSEMPFFVRLYLNCKPELVASELPQVLTVNLPFRGLLDLPVRPEYTGTFHG